MNSYTWGSTRAKVKSVGVHSIDAMTALELRLVAMIDKKLGSLNSSPSSMAP